MWPPQMNKSSLKWWAGTEAKVIVQSSRRKVCSLEGQCSFQTQVGFGSKPQEVLAHLSATSGNQAFTRRLTLRSRLKRIKSHYTLPVTELRCELFAGHVYTVVDERPRCLSCQVHYSLTSTRPRISKADTPSKLTEHYGTALHQRRTVRSPRSNANASHTWKPPQTDWLA